MNKFKQKLNDLAVRLNDSVLGVRLAFLGASLFILVFIWYAVVFTPMESKATNLIRNINSVNTQTEALTTEINKITLAIAESESKQNGHVNLQDKLKSLTTDIGVYTGAFVPVSKMVDVLRDMLIHSKSLSLISIKTLAPQILQAKTDQANTNGGQIFQHGVKVTFSGSYFACVDYLKRLETLKWRLFWDSLQYKVDTYPNATITLTLHTLGRR